MKFLWVHMPWFLHNLYKLSPIKTSHCTENELICLFLVLVGTSFLSYDIKIKMNCPCGLPDCIQDLVQCHSCDTWYHMYHTTRSLKGDWECDNCFLAESL